MISARARTRLAAGLAVALVATLGATASAYAEEPTVRVRVVPATEIFMTGGALTGVVEAFDAASDLTQPVASATIPPDLFALAEPSIALDLPPGSYKVRTDIDGYLPSWYQSPPQGADTTGDLGDLGWLFGPRSDGSAATASIITVGADGFADRPEISLMVHDTTTSIAGIIGNWAGSSWSMTQVLGDDQAAFVELYPVGGAEPIATLEATVAGAFVFRDIPLGSYEVRAILGTWPDAVATWPHPGLTADELGDAKARWYPGDADRSAGMSVTIDSAHPHWDGASVAMDDAADGVSLDVAALTGDSFEGGTLFASLGGASLGIPSSVILTTGYQWRIDGADVAGATGSSFVVPTGTAGHSVTAEIFTLLAPAAIRSAGESVPTVITTPTQPVLTATPTPIVSGTVSVGQKLTADPGTWGPGSVPKTFQWNRDGTAIPDATTKAYKIGIEDVGAVLTFTVTGAKPGYTVTSRTSAPLGPVPALTFTRAPTPTVVGALRVGVVLRVGAVNWAPAPDTLAYQWMRDGVAIPEATGATYALTADDLGTAVTVGVVARKAGYVTASRSSAPPAALVDAGRITAPRPDLIGTAQKGQTLSIDTSAWTPAELTIGYQWERQVGGGAGFAAIPAAIGATYTLTADDVGKKVRLVVTVDKPGYDQVVRTTLPTVKVIS